MQDSSAGHKYIPTYVCKPKKKKKAKRKQNKEIGCSRGSGYSSLLWFELRLNVLRIIYSRWLLKFKSHKQVLTLVNILFLT